MRSAPLLILLLVASTTLTLTLAMPPRKSTEARPWLQDQSAIQKAQRHIDSLKVRLEINQKALERATTAANIARYTADSEPNQDNIEDFNEKEEMRLSQQENLDSLIANIAEREKNLLDNYGVSPSRASDEDEDSEETVTD